MENGFKDFIYAELNEIKKCIGDEKKDPDELREDALKWISENAVKFRMKWNRKLKTHN